MSGWATSLKQLVLQPGFPSEDELVAQKVHWTLRIAAAGCFIGHGAWGLLQKEEWVHLFTPFGISREAAFSLMPVIGTVDITMGLLVLFRPAPVFVAFMTFWALWTALLRPLVGLSWYEVTERAGNYGIPAIMLFIAFTAVQPRPKWFARLGPTAVSLDQARLWRRLLLLVTALLLIGHGGFGADLAKERLLGHWDLVGLGTVEVVRLVGAFEIVLGLLVLVAPSARLLLFVLGWKLFTELFYPMSGQGIWEFVERAGSFGAPLAAYYLTGWIQQRTRRHTR